MGTATLPQIKTLADLKRYFAIGDKIRHAWNRHPDWGKPDCFGPSTMTIGKVQKNALAFVRDDVPATDGRGFYWHRFGKAGDYRFDDAGFDFFVGDERVSRYEYVPQE